MLLEDLMRDAGVRASRDFDTTEIAVVPKPLRRSADDGPLSRRARRDERAVDVPKKTASRTRNVVEESVDSCKFEKSERFLVLRLLRSALNDKLMSSQF
jgi:hypothetical protein